MNGAISERPCERVVDEPVLLDQREPFEARACDHDLEMVAAARAVLDAELVRIGERIAQQRFEALDSHAVMLLTPWPSTGAESGYAVTGSYVGVSASGACRSYVGS